MLHNIPAAGTTYLLTHFFPTRIADLYTGFVITLIRGKPSRSSSILAKNLRDKAARCALVASDGKRDVAEAGVNALDCRFEMALL